MRCLFNLLYGSVPAEFESPFGTVRHVLPRSANVKRPPRLGGLFYRKQPRYERRHARTGALATTGKSRPEGLSFLTGSRHLPEPYPVGRYY